MHACRYIHSIGYMQHTLFPGWRKLVRLRGRPPTTEFVDGIDVSMDGVSNPRNASYWIRPPETVRFPEVLNAAIVAAADEGIWDTHAAIRMFLGVSRSVTPRVSSF
jgi:hypothetical protein